MCNLIRCLFTLLILVLLAACAPAAASPTATAAQPTLTVTSAPACEITEPVHAQPEPDAAVTGTIPPSFYFINEDRSIWASTGWLDPEQNSIARYPEGFKVGWFRPAGATLEATGRRLDGDAPPLDVQIECCYPTRFQSSRLLFPTPGCWEVTARAASSTLTFVVEILP